MHFSTVDLATWEPLFFGGIQPHLPIERPPD